MDDWLNIINDLLNTQISIDDLPPAENIAAADLAGGIAGGIVGGIAGNAGGVIPGAIGGAIGVSIYELLYPWLWHNTLEVII